MRPPSLHKDEWRVQKIVQYHTETARHLPLEYLDIRICWWRVKYDPLELLFILHFRYIEGGIFFVNSIDNDFFCNVVLIVFFSDRKTSLSRASIDGIASFLKFFGQKSYIAKFKLFGYLSSLMVFLKFVQQAFYLISEKPK